MKCRLLMTIFLVFLSMTVIACNEDGAGADGDVTDGDITDGDVTDGDVTDGDVTDGDVAEDDVTDGDAADGDVTDGDVAEDDVTDGDVAEDDVVDGDVAEDDVVDGDVAEDDVVDGDVAEDDIVEDDVVEDDEVEETVTPGTQCDVCQGNDDCAANHACLGFQGAPQKFCAESCSQQDDCDADFLCQDIGGSVNYCIPGRNYSCESNDLWRVDACGFEALLLECDETRVCNAEGKSCDLVVDGDVDDVDSVEDTDTDIEVVPGMQCSICNGNEDCAADHTCIEMTGTGRSVCVKSCVQQSDCDQSFQCYNIGIPTNYCVPGGNYYCRDNDLYLFDACQVESMVADCNDATEACNAETRTCDSTLPVTSIYDIQYTTVAGDGTYPSLLADQEVTTRGIVVASGFSGYNNNFFIADASGGAWNGLYVFGADAEPNPGDEVRVTGTVKEYFGFTEIANPAVTVLTTGNDLPSFVEVSTGDLTQPATAEAYEAVLVKLTGVVVTQEPDSHNEWYVDDGSGACQVDDGMYTTPDVAVDASYDYIIGLVDYNYSAYGVNPRNEGDVQKTAATPVVGPLIQNQWTTFTWPYNAYYPEDSDGPNGHFGNACGYTSLARILHYWQYPANGVGHLQFTDYWGQPWDVDLENMNLDYSQMPATLAYDATQAEYHETARLFEATGAVGEMIHIWGTGAEDDVPQAMVDYFKFSDNADIVYRENFTRQEWIDIFTGELDNGRPIIIVGRTPDSPAPGQPGRIYGHWWICDGYDSDGNFYVDYAFNNIRGYYDIDNLGGVYTAYNRAIIGLEPAAPVR